MKLVFSLLAALCFSWATARAADDVWVRQAAHIPNPVAKGPAWAGWELRITETSATLKATDPQKNPVSLLVSWDVPPPQLRPGHVISLSCRAQTVQGVSLTARYGFDDLRYWLDEESYQKSPTSASGCSSTPSNSYPASYAVSARMLDPLKRESFIIRMEVTFTGTTLAILWLYQRQAVRKPDSPGGPEPPGKKDSDKTKDTGSLRPPAAEPDMELLFDPDENPPLQAALDPPALVVVAGGPVQSTTIFVGGGRPDAPGPVKIDIGQAEGPGLDTQGKDITVVLADSAGEIVQGGGATGASSIREFTLNVSARSIAPLSVAKVPIVVSQPGEDPVRLTLWVAVNPAPLESFPDENESRPYALVARKTEGEEARPETKRPEIAAKKPEPPTVSGANVPAILGSDGSLDLTLVGCRLRRQEAGFVVTKLGPENPQKPHLLKVGAVLQFIFDLADGRAREAATLSMEDIARVLNTPGDENLIILRFVLPDGDTRDIQHPGRLF